MADLGNTLDALLKPEWLAIVHGVEALATNAEGQVKADLQNAQTQLSTALSGAATAVQAAQTQVDTALNPVVNEGVQAAATAISAAYPPFAALAAAAAPEVENLADAGTDAIASKVLTWAYGLLSASAKATAVTSLQSVPIAVPVGD